ARFCSSRRSPRSSRSCYSSRPENEWRRPMRERRWTRRLGLAIVVVLGVATLMASAASAATFVYIGNTDSNEIIVLRLDPQSGELAPVERVTIPGVTKPG